MAADVVLVLEKWLVITAVLYLAAMCFVKLSILFLYLRLFAVRPTIRIATYIAIALLLLSSVLAFFLYMFGCRTVQALFNPYAEGVQCLNRTQLLLWPGVANLVTDLFTLVIPIPLIWGLQLSTGRKIGVLIILGLGSRLGRMFSHFFHLVSGQLQLTLLVPYV